MASAAAAAPAGDEADPWLPAVVHSGPGSWKGHASYADWAARRGYVYVVMLGKGKKMHYSPWDDDWQSWLEECLTKGRLFRENVDVDGTKYDIDLHNWTQENKTTGTRRAIGRMSTAEYIEYERNRSAGRD